MNAPPRESESIKGLHAHEQRQRAVESARESDHDISATDRLKTRCESGGLDRQDLLAPRPAVRRGRRYERMRIDRTKQRGERPSIRVRIHRVKRSDAAHRRGRPSRLAISEVGATLELKKSDVDVCKSQDTFAQEASPLRQNGPVLGNERVSAKDKIGRRFSDASSSIDIGAETTRGLSDNQRTTIVRLADELVGSAQIQDDVRTPERQARRRRIGGPHVLADLNAKDDAAPEVKDKIISERNGHATQGDFRVRRL